MERYRRVLLVVMLVGVMFGVARPAVASGEVDLAILKEVDFVDVPLEVVLATISKEVPSFKFAVIRQEGIPEDFPRIKLKVKQVGINQILTLIHTANPSIECSPIDGPDGPVYCITVNEPSARPEPNGAAAHSNVNVIVYRLSGIVSALAAKKAGPDSTKDALNQVLSLFKATLEQVHGEPPTLRIHEETQTLIFKGNNAQEEALRGAMEALSPSQSEWQATMKRQADERVAASMGDRERMVEQVVESKQRLDSMRKSLDEGQERFLKQTEESERLKVRLEMMQDKAKELEGVVHNKSLDIEAARAELRRREENTQQVLDALGRSKDFERQLLEKSNEATELRKQLEATKGK